MVGGEESIFREVKDVLRAVGTNVGYMGPIGAGSIAKLVHNMISIVSRCLVAEGFTLGVKAGVKPEALLEAIRGASFGQGLMLSHMIPDVVFKGDFDTVRFALKLARKDVGLATALAREYDVPMPLATAGEQQLIECLARGWGERDSTSPWLLQEERARRAGAGIQMSFALDGVRVLELARFQAGPRGGMVLSDLGAEVIKIEPPGGEETRKHPPMVRGQSVYFTVYNRGKKSVCLDMRSERGKEIFAALVKKSDIVLENFRPGVMRAMGFDYERLRALNPGIILVSVSGFGQYGPYTERPAFDPLGQAMSGLMTLTGQPVGQPLGTASSVVDRYTALHATIGTLAALRHRERTGEGQVVDVCLLDSALTMVEIPTSYYLATGAEGGEAGRPPYRAKDGWVVISAAGREMAANAHAHRRGRGGQHADGGEQRGRSPARVRGALVRRAHGGGGLRHARGGRAFPSGRCGRSPRWRRTRISGSARCS